MKALPLVTALVISFPASAWAGPVRGARGQYLSPSNPAADRYQEGSLSLGYYFRNRDNAAASRPDGSGSAHLLQRLFLRDAVRGDHLSLLADVTTLTGRESGKRFELTQCDYLLGVALQSGAFRLQFDREEYLPVDRGGLSYRYWDARGALVFGDLGGPPGKQPNRRGGGFGGLLSVGHFLRNKAFPARRDLSGEAYMRYGARLEALALRGLRLSVEADALTDEHHRRYAPANLDLSLGVGFRHKGVETGIVRESSDALDRPGYDSRWLFLVTYHFDSSR